MRSARRARDTSPAQADIANSSTAARADIHPTVSKRSMARQATSVTTNSAPQASASARSEGMWRTRRAHRRPNRQLAIPQADDARNAVPATAYPAGAFALRPAISIVWPCSKGTLESRNAAARRHGIDQSTPAMHRARRRDRILSMAVSSGSGGLYRWAYHTGLTEIALAVVSPRAVLSGLFAAGASEGEHPVHWVRGCFARGSRVGATRAPNRRALPAPFFGRGRRPPFPSRRRRLRTRMPASPPVRDAGNKKTPLFRTACHVWWSLGGSNP